MHKSLLNISVNEIRSHWHENIFEEWMPDRDYIKYLKKQIKKNDYLPPIVVVRENNGYTIVNGHHRYYAHAALGKKEIRCIAIDGTFKESEPIRKAEVLLKQFDRKTGYRYQFSGYLDRWAAAVEKHDFINKFRPTHNIININVIRRILNKVKLIVKLIIKKIKGEK